MPNYLFAYTGGDTPASEEEGKKVMAAWMSWMGGVGDALADGGAPFSGTSRSVGSGDKVSDGAASGLTGYSVIRADDIDGALAHAKTCPQLAANGEIQIFETAQIEM